MALHSQRQETGDRKGRQERGKGQTHRKTAGRPTGRTRGRQIKHKKNTKGQNGRKTRFNRMAENTPTENKTHNTRYLITICLFLERVSTRDMAVHKLSHTPVSRIWLHVRDTLP